MAQKNTLKKAAIGFGAAAASIYAAPELSASIVTLNFNPSSVAYDGSISNHVSVTVTSAGGNDIGGWMQFNDSVGKTLWWDSGFASWTQVNAGDVLNTSNFTGTTSGIYFSPGQGGTVYVGFRATAANGGGVGWFGMDLGGPSGDIVFNAGEGGQYGNQGESVTVGESRVVPELGSAYGVGLLAMGAIGIGRRRRQAKK